MDRYSTCQTTLAGDIVEPTEEALRHLYEEQEYSVSQLMRVFDCSTTEIYDALRDCDLLADEQFPDALPTLVTDHEGYERWEYGPHRVRVHRLLMVAECGFAAVADAEVVHHESFTWDNRPDALLLFETHADHMDHHNARLDGDHENQQLLPDVDYSSMKAEASEEAPESMEMESQRTLDEFVRV